MAGFVLGLVGLLFAVIPVVGVIAWPLTILGVIFGAVGLVRADNGRADNKGMAIAAIVLSAIGLVICLVWTVAFGAAVKDAADDVRTAAAAHSGGNTAPKVAAGRHAIVIEVTAGSKSNLDWRAGFGTHSQDVVPAGEKWGRALDMKDRTFVTVSLRAVDFELGNEDNTCKITVDGKVVSEKANSVGAVRLPAVTAEPARANTPGPVLGVACALTTCPSG
ncbi:DUF4190 domain-containing protein [Amycolatopsis sp. NPDC004368]